MQWLSWMYNIKLSTIGIFAIIFTTIGLIALVLMIASQCRLTYLAQNNKSENDNVVTISVSPKLINKLEKQINISIWIAAIGLLFAIICVLIFIKYNNTALKYGAYKNVQWSQTIQEIIDCEKVGYTESPDIPDDLSGCIVIYFKYGCPDCRDIHDDLMTYLSLHPIDKLYFVSTRSDKGKELMVKYPVVEIPTAIYVRQKESNISDIYQEILYYKANDDDETQAVFRQDGLEFLVRQQTEGE